MDPSPQHGPQEAQQHHEEQEKPQAGISILSTAHNDAIDDNIIGGTPSVQSIVCHSPSIKNNGSNITLSHLENIPSATEIKLSIKNLSLSIVPEPSFIIRLCRLLARKSKSKRTHASNAKNKNRCSDYTLAREEYLDQIESKTGLPAEANFQQVQWEEESPEEHLQHFTGINIFRHISFDVEPGQVCLIMGGSGSGKTTLLNALAGRMNPQQIKTTGTIRMNGQCPKAFWKSGHIGFLQQDDRLLPFLTVRETLRFAADLRLSGWMTIEERNNRVESLIVELGLKTCAETMIGNVSASESDQGGSGTGGSGVGRRGLSGGERRRVSAAVQLLTNPRMLLCDEVTSGLDAFSSFEIMKTLTSFAQSSNKSVILSIHQPRSEIFKLLTESNGQLVLLSKGDLLYSGSLAGVLPWLESTGLPSCPLDMNPFDHILDMTSIDFSSEDNECSSTKRRDRLVKAWKEKTAMGGGNKKREQQKVGTPPSFVISTEEFQEPTTSTSTSTLVVPDVNDDMAKAGHHNKIIENARVASNSNDLVSISNTNNSAGTPRFRVDSQLEIPIRRQTRLLIRRAWLNKSRDGAMFWTMTAINITLALTVGVIFWKLGLTEADVRPRASLSYVFVASQPYLWLLIGIYRAAAEMKVFERERMDRWYTPMSYILSNSVCNIPENIIHPLVYTLIVYYMTGLRTDSIQYACWCVVINIAFQFTISFFCLFATVIDSDFDGASLFATSCYLPFAIQSGYIIASSQIPKPIEWINYISFPRLGYQTMVSVQFTDLHLDCPYRQPAPDGSGSQTWDAVRCAPWDGNSILLGQLEATPGYFPGPIAFFLVYCAVYAILSWALLAARSPNAIKVASGKSPMELMFFFLWDTVSCAGVRNSAETCTQPTAKHSEAIDEHEPQEIAVEAGATRVEMFGEKLTSLEPVTIRIERLTLSINITTWDWIRPRAWIMLPKKRRTQKTILQDVDFVIPPGQLTAILGGSGSGKTSLLNVLLNRTSGDLNIQGNVYFNGTMNPSVHKINTVCGFVRQEDNFLLSHLTVRETLKYAAELGLPSRKAIASGLSTVEKHAKVEEIIDIMGLRDCAETLVGNSENSGISGGQKRRVSIGVKLILEPACLFLDEPTTGLDAVSALAIVQTLKKIADSGRTVVCTIHQPRNDIWNTFDNVFLLLTGGRLAYAGKADKVIDYFEAVGHILPLHANPPDFIIDTASINSRTPELEAMTRARVEELAALHIQSEMLRRQEFVQSAPLLAEGATSSPTAGLRPLGDVVPHYAGLTKAVPILVRRLFRNHLRQKGTWLNRVNQPTVLVTVLIIYFHNLGSQPMGIFSRLGCFQQMTGVTAAAILASLAAFPREKDVAFREISNGSYGASSFLLSYMVNEIPLAIFTSTLCATLIVFATGLQRTPTTILSMILVLFAFITSGESIGIIYTVWISHQGLGVTLVNSTVLLLTFMAGFMVPALPWFLAILNHFSVFKFTSTVLAVNEFSGLRVDCTAEMVQSGACPWRSGAAVLRQLHFEHMDLATNVVMIVVLIVVYRLMAWASLVIRARKCLR